MSINACVYDSRHVLAGCITDSVIERFNDEFESLKKKYFGDIVNPLLAVMEKALIQSTDNMSADFLNCLKLLSRKYRNDAPIGFVQDASRVYHSLVRYCCSQQVYDEVMDETVSQFRKAGFDYLSSNSQGFDQEYCWFEYRGKKVGIRMRNRSDLYGLWDMGNDAGTHVIVTDNGDTFEEDIQGSPMEIAEEIISFIDERLMEEQEAPDKSILDELMHAIEDIVNIGNC